MAQRFRRRRKLIRPGLQLRLSAKFVGLIALMLGLQFVLLDALIGQTAAGEPEAPSTASTSSSRPSLPERGPRTFACARGMS